MGNPEETPCSGVFPRMSDSNPAEITHKVGSLKELISIATGRFSAENLIEEDFGTVEPLPFPFLGLVGQVEMKLALILAMVNPLIGGVLLIGPRGTGKTTAVRSLLDILPQIQRSNCFYGCMPEDIEIGGIDAVCSDCAKKYAEGKSLTRTEKASLVELPLNSRLEDVVGGLDERSAMNNQIRIKRGILSHANQNILFIDEVNLLNSDIGDVILDAAAMGCFTVRRGPVSATYKAKFILIGSMNPEEGNLRPQIMDRFGLRVIVRGLEDPQERLSAYVASREYSINPRQYIRNFEIETGQMAEELQNIRNNLRKIIIPEAVMHSGINLIRQLKIDSLRAEISLFEAARAYSAIDNRKVVDINDIRVVAPLALRLRHSQFIDNYFSERSSEDRTINELLDSIIPPDSSVQK